MQIQLLPTSAEQLPLLANLYQFYAYESSDWEQEDVETDGRFYIHQPHLQRYWQDPGWSAQLILAEIRDSPEPRLQALLALALVRLRR